MNMRYFPFASYMRIFGGAGIGYVIGKGSLSAVPSNADLTIAGVSFVMSMVGWFLMRPLMAEAKKDIRQANTIKSQPPVLNVDEPK